MSNTTTMTLYATERAIGCRSSMSSSSSNEKFFFTARRPPKGATTKVRLSLHSFPIYPQNFSPPPPPASIFARAKMHTTTVKYY